MGSCISSLIPKATSVKPVHLNCRDKEERRISHTLATKRVWVRTLKEYCLFHKIIGPTYCVLFPSLAKRFKSRQWKFLFLHVEDSYCIYLPCIYSPILWFWLHFSSDTDPPLLSVTFTVIHFLVLCIPKWKPEVLYAGFILSFSTKNKHIKLSLPPIVVSSDVPSSFSYQCCYNHLSVLWHMVLLFDKIIAQNGKCDSAVPRNSKYDFSHEHKAIESKMKNI